MISVIIAATLGVLTQGDFTILDKSEFEKRPKVKYHLYDPQLFDMYRKCMPIINRPCYTANDPKHALDVHFVESIIALNESVDPWDATLFIVPVLYSQFDGGPQAICRYHHMPKAITQMYEVLHSLGHYKHGIRNHFLMADHFAAGLPHNTWAKFTFEPELIVGRFEHPLLSVLYSITSDIDESQFFGVGYSTHEGLLRHCPSNHLTTFRSPLPSRERKYLLSFTGGVLLNDGWHRYNNRLVLWEYIEHHYLPEDTFISMYAKFAHNKNFTWLNGPEILHNSSFVLQLGGDSPTTERLWIAFEHHTMLCAVTSEKEALLTILPFPLRVPWEELILWIDADEFVKEPVQAMREAILGLSDIEWERRYNLMLKHKRDVLWGYEDSVAVFNVLEEAARRVKNV